MKHLTSLAVALAVAVSTLSAPAYAADRRAADQPGVVPEGHSIMLVFATPVTGKDAEFQTWYDTHASAITRLPGYVRSQRFKRQSRAGKPDPAYPYVTMYEFVGDPDTVVGGIGKAVKEGKVKAPDPAIVQKVESMAYVAMQPGFAHP